MIAMSETGKLSPSTSFFSKFTSSFLKDENIQQIAKSALLELALCLAFAAVTSLFVATSLGVAFVFLKAIITIAVNLFLRVSLRDGVKRTIDPKNYLDRGVNTFMPYSPATLFSCFDLGTRHTITHELGHVVAAKMLYNITSGPSISISPWTGSGFTTFRYSSLSTLGASIGVKASKLILLAAGTISTSLISVISLIGASCLRNKAPEVSKYLNVLTIIATVQGVLYALSALWTTIGDNPSHDFVQLALGGIHPLIATVTIIAIPLMFKGGLMLLNKMTGCFDAVKVEDTQGLILG